MQTRRSLRILVADDDPIQLRVAARLLRELGHTGALANNGQRALDMLSQQPFDLLLLDLNMPVLDGLATLAGLRERQARGQPTPQVILASGNDLAQGWSFYHNASTFAYLVKPLDIQSLESVLRRL